MKKLPFVSDARKILYICICVILASIILNSCSSMQKTDKSKIVSEEKNQPYWFTDLKVRYEYFGNQYVIGVGLADNEVKAREAAVAEIQTIINTLYGFAYSAFIETVQTQPQSKNFENLLLKDFDCSVVNYTTDLRKEKYEKGQYLVVVGIDQKSFLEKKFEIFMKQLQDSITVSEIFLQFSNEHTIDTLLSQFKESKKEFINKNHKDAPDWFKDIKILEVEYPYFIIAAGRGSSVSPEMSLRKAETAALQEIVDVTINTLNTLYDRYFDQCRYSGNADIYKQNRFSSKMNIQGSRMIKRFFTEDAAYIAIAVDTQKNLEKIIQGKNMEQKEKLQKYTQYSSFFATCDIGQFDKLLTDQKKQLQDSQLKTDSIVL